MKLPPPDFSLVEQHSRYLRTWKDQKTTKIKQMIENGHPMNPRCFICGYDFNSGTYQHSEMILDTGVLEDDKWKLHSYYWLRNQIRISLFTPLAVMFMAPGKINASYDMDDDQWETVLYITFETEHLASFQLYRIINHVTDSDEQPQRSLVYDAYLSDMQICDEMKIFLSLFHAEVVKN